MTLEIFIDGILIHEGTYTAYGDPRNLTLQPMLINGSFPQDISAKIIPLVMDFFPEEAVLNGWAYDDAIRDFPFRNGLPSQLQNISDDGIFIHTDADEVVAREVLLFLKLHDNIPEPYIFNLKKTVYGFFWYSGEWQIHAGATFGMMKNVFLMRPQFLRGNRYEKNTLVAKYLNSTPNAVLGPFSIGTVQHPAGYHCSYCTPPSGIRTKLISAFNADFPRWGDYPMKCDLSYIESLIGKGMGFSETSCLSACDSNQPNYAPAYILQNPKAFQYLLQNPYSNKNVSCNPDPKTSKGLYLKNWHRMSKAKFQEHMNQSHIVPPENLLGILH